MTRGSSSLHGERGAADHAGGRTAFDDVRRRDRGELDRCQPAVRLHQLQRRRDAEFAQSRGERCDIGAHHRLHIGVDHRRAGARIFLDLRQDLVADGNRHTRAAPRAPHRPPRARAPGWRRNAAGRSRRSAPPRGAACRSPRRRSPHRAAVATEPSGRSFSITSSRSRRSTRARGLVQCRSYSTGMRRSRISRMSRKPLVVISAVRAPLPSRIALEPIVVPCSTSATGLAVATPAACADRR